MDILTEAGQKTIPQERQLIRSFQARWPSLKCFPTDSNRPARLDGVVTKNGILSAVYESKCRACNSQQMKQWNNEWLVSYDKIKAGADAAALLQVPFIGLLFLTQEPVGLHILIANHHGELQPHIRIERTTTKQSVNGGEATRSNAFIDISRAERFKIIQP